MNINLVVAPPRSYGDIRRAISRQFVVFLLILVGGGVIASLLRYEARIAMKHVPSHSDANFSFTSTSLVVEELRRCQQQQKWLEERAARYTEGRISRLRPRALLHAIGSNLPPDVWVRKISIRGDTVDIIGRAISHSAVSKFIETAGLGTLLSTPSLESSRASASDTRDEYEFTITAHWTSNTVVLEAIPAYVGEPALSSEVDGHGR